MRVACALSRDHERRADAREALDKAESWIRRWAADPEDETRHWDLAADDVARAAEARFRLDGLQAAVAELKRWLPAAAALQAAAHLAARVAGDLSPDQVRELLRHSRVPAADQAPILAHLTAAHGAVDPSSLDEVVTALLWLDLAELLARDRAYADHAADLCARAAGHVHTGSQPAPDRLETLARAAEIAAPLNAASIQGS